MIAALAIVSPDLFAKVSRTSVLVGGGTTGRRRQQLTPASPASPAPGPTEVESRRLRPLNQIVSSERAPVALHTATGGGYAILTASIIGQTHLDYGEGREDNFAYAHGPVPGAVTLAVADGVGNSPNSHLASSLVTMKALERIRRIPLADWQRILQDEQWDGFSSWLVREVAQDLSRRYNETNSHPKQPATTLSLAIVIRDPAGLRVYWTAVGDSPIFALEGKHGQITGIFNPPQSNGVEALPKHVDARRCGVERLQAGRAVLVLSDGMERVLTNFPKLPEQLYTLVRSSDKPAAALPLLLRAAADEFDDSTIIMAAPVGDAPG